MNKFTTFCLLAILLAGNLSNLLAQNTVQPTPYQKKQLELSKKYFEIFYGYKMSMADAAFYEELAEGKDVQDFILGVGILNYAMQHSEEQVKKVLTQMEKEFAAAEKLKNATDIRLEKEAKIRKEQEEREKKLRAEQAAYEKTDIGSIQKEIISAFNKWNQKGEFEKEADYAERLQKQSQIAFNEICIKMIKDQINNKTSDYWKKELSTYDSEGEFFIVNFKTNGIIWQSKINIPISQAENLKKNWTNMEFQIDEHDWCFVENNLCPTIVILKNTNEEYKFFLPLNNQSDIAYSFNELKIDNIYLKDYVFKYSTTKAIIEQRRKEKQRLDSLELVAYNQKLDSILKDYNHQLLQNPYNIYQKSMSPSIYQEKLQRQKEQYYHKEKEEIEENNLKNFNIAVTAIKNAYTQMDGDFSKNLLAQNPARYFEIFYEQNPDKKIVADREYLNCRCDYPKRVDFDSYISRNNWQVGYDCGCREKLYSGRGSATMGVKDYFIDRNEFNKFYDQGEDILLQEVEKRKAKREIENLAKNGGQILGSPTTDRLKALYDSIQKYNNKPFYTELIEIAIDSHNLLNKEWNKNGQYFESKIEFYNAYFSDDYKTILKKKK